MYIKVVTMYKVVFTYRTPTQYLSELMQKFADSAAPQFESSPSNCGISMCQREVEGETEVVLDIYYATLDDYRARTAFERAQSEWNRIWFAPDIKHREVSVAVFEVLHSAISHERSAISSQ